MMDYWKSLGDVVVKASSKLEKELETAIFSTQKKWDKIQKQYSEAYTEFTHGDKQKGEKMLLEFSTDIGEYALAFTALNSSIITSYACITEMLDRFMDY